MEFRILGPLEALEDGRPLALGRLKERSVLAVLLLHANEFVSRERLIDELWGLSPPATARKAVNVYIWKLRQTLARDGHDPIATADGGYRLVVGPDLLDADRMRSLVAEARERMAGGESEAASRMLQEALAFWRGPTLAGLALESFGRDEVAQLDELRLTVLMDRIECDLAQGRHERVLGELQVLVREHPLRERLRAQQMLALYRADRQADALDAYQQARHTLIDELGIEPSESLQRLQQAILRHDPALEAPTGTAATNGVAAAVAPADDAALAVLPRRSRPRRPAIRRRYLVVAGLAAVASLATEVRTRPSPARPTPVPGGARHVPEGAYEQAPSSNQRRYVVSFVAACLGVLAAMLAFNIIIDPFALAGTGIVPTAVEPDRSIKLDLLQHLKRGPQILIMGSSRSRQAEPSYLQKLTGLTGFNAGVTGGTSADEYVFARFAADLFPHQKRRYIWFTDVGIAGGGVLPQLAHDPRARRYVRGGVRFGLGNVETYLSIDATKASWRVFEKCVLASCRSHIIFRPDGSLTNQSLHYLPEHAKSLRKSVAKLLTAVRTHHATLAQARADLAQPGRFFYFEQALAFMNRRGEVPVIVLNPVYPSVLAQLEKYGYAGRRATLEKVAELHKRFRFGFVDAEDIRKWGGNTRDWENATHINRGNMRTLLRYVVAHSDGALR